MEMQPYLRKVQFYETDAMAIVHHANYVHWMEEARIWFMEQMGYPYEKCSQNGIDLGQVDLQCKYRDMVRFGDTVRIELDITKLTNARVEVGYRMYNESTGKLCFTGQSGHFFLDNRSGKPAALKRVIPELYDLFHSLYQDYLSRTEQLT